MIIFYPVSLLFALVVTVREALYKFKIIKSYKVQTKVLSIGNLTFGGTGKTPVVDFLLENLKHKKKIAVLSRGYGRKTKGFFKVDTNAKEATTLYGDEPVFLAKKHPDVPIFVCEDRVQGCREIEAQGKFDLIIADDAFQHLRLARDLDVVVVDATEKMSHYFYPPVGRARNSWGYLSRADFVFLTKTNLCRAEDLEPVREKLKKYNIIEFESVLDGIYNLKSGQRLESLNRASLISGIGKPKTFEYLLKKTYRDILIKKHFIYNDHHAYKASDIVNIKCDITDEVLITTEKDAVKLSSYANELNLFVARLKFITKNSMERFYEAVY